MTFVLLRLAALAMAIVGGAIGVRVAAPEKPVPARSVEMAIIAETSFGAGIVPMAPVLHPSLVAGGGHELVEGSWAMPDAARAAPEERESEMAFRDLVDRDPIVILPAPTVIAQAVTPTPPPKPKAKQRWPPRTKFATPACGWRCQIARRTAWMRRAFEGV